MKGFYNDILINSYDIFDLVNNKVVHESSKSWMFSSGSKAYFQSGCDDSLTCFDVSTLEETKIPCPPKFLSHVNSDYFYFENEDESIFVYKLIDSIFEKIATINQPLNYFSENYIGGYTNEGKFTVHSNIDGKECITPKEYEHAFFSGERYLWGFTENDIECVDVDINNIVGRIARENRYLGTIGEGFMLLKSNKDNEVYCYRTSEPLSIK